MESIFKNQKARQQNLITDQHVKRVETPNQLEEIKHSENLVFQGAANINDQDVNMEEEKPQLSFVITSCYKLALKPELKLSTGCKILNDFLR